MLNNIIPRNLLLGFIRGEQFKLILGLGESTQLFSSVSVFETYLNEITTNIHLLFFIFYIMANFFSYFKRCELAVII